MAKALPCLAQLLPLSGRPSLATRPNVGVALLVSLLGLAAVAPRIAAQDKVVYGNPLGASIRHPGSARQCSEIEVVIASESGHEWIYAHSLPGLGPLRTWTEKCGYGAGPCVSDAGGGTSSDWAPSIGYRGPIHVRYLVASGGAAAIEFWLTYMGGSYTSYHYSTYESRTQMSVSDAGRSAYLNLEVGDWRTPPVIPADGASTIPISARLMDSSCKAKVDYVDLRTTLGTLVADGQSGQTIRVRTTSSGTVSATLKADTASGVAEVSAAASGQLATGRAYMYGLVLSAPAELPANGTSSGIVTATLDCNGTPPPIDDYLRNKIDIAISTSAGTLVLPVSGSKPAASVSGHPGPLGSLTASLQSTAKPQTANLRATSGGVEAFATTEFTGPKVRLTATRTEYRSVSGATGQQGTPGSLPLGSQTPYRDVVEPTRYGISTVEVTATLSLGSDPASGKQILLTSVQKDAVGSSFIDFPDSVTTGADGTVKFTLRTTDLYKASIALPHIVLKATYAGDTTVTHELDVKTIDNFASVLARYNGSMGTGAVHDTAVQDAIALMSPSDRALLEGMYPGLRNDLLASQAYGAAYPAITSRQDDLLAGTSPWWQHRVLQFLNNLQWTSYSSSVGSGDDRWLLNGLDYGPLFVEGDSHLAVVVYPQAESWQGGHARVLDPWLEQQGLYYGYAQWKALLADPQLARAGSGVDVQPQEFTPGTFGGSNGPSQHYPINGEPYYADVDAVPTPYDPTAKPSFADYFTFLETVFVECPVFATVQDAQGRRSGYAPAPSAQPTVDEIPGLVRSTLAGPDGTLRWRFTVPDNAATPLTLRLQAYASGPMTISIVRARQGRRWVYRDVVVTAGETATLQFVPAATTPPPLQFTGSGGRAVQGVIEPIGVPGASPGHVVLGGGRQVTIGGLVFAGGGPLQPGATVRIAGREATNVTVLNGSTLAATVPAGTAEGPVDIVVTNPGGEQATLTAGLTYYLARHYFAEGATSGFFDTRLALLNPGTLGAEATLNFLDASGVVHHHTVPIPAMTRATIDPKQVMPAGTHEFSTVIEATQPLVADRTMTWDATGYGSHAETSLPSPATTWYLAEGATHSGFDLFYLLQNPAATETTARVQYLRPSGPPIEKSYPLPPRSRTNIWVDNEQFTGLGAALAATDVSAVITSTDDTPIIVERAMYLSNQGRAFNAGHESAGITSPSTSWFLAEGATGSFFDLFVLLANPGDRDAQARVTYLLPDGTTYTKTMAVPAKSRQNIWVNLDTPDGTTGYPLADTAVSTTVQVTNGVPIIVERAMWWVGGGGPWQEAHNSAGATSTGTAWALAEGEVGGPAAQETYILVANTSPFAGQARVTLVFENGTSASKTFDLAKTSRTNVAVGAEFPEAVGQRFGALVESLGDTPAQLVVERAMYSNAGGVAWSAGTNALATKLR
jgi:hypothetical protein